VLFIVSALLVAGTLLDLAVLGNISVRDGKWENVFQPIDGNHGKWRHYYTHRLFGLPFGCDDYREFWFDVWGRGEDKFSVRQLIDRVFGWSYCAAIAAGMAACLRFSFGRLCYALECVGFCLGQFCFRPRTWLLLFDCLVGRSGETMGC